MFQMDIDATESLVRKLLTDDVYYNVPDFQRSYSWKKQHWVDFWSDLDSISKGETHYLGSAVFIDKERGFGNSTYDVIDGQQRLTTISVLLCAIRDRYNKLNDPDDIEEYINTEYLKTRNSKNDYEQTLSLSEYDKSDFNALIEGRYNAIESESKILECFNFFEEKLSNSDLEYLEDLRTKLTESMSIVIVTCESEGSAFRLFETLNNRGMELTAIDLMKNALLQYASKEYPSGSDDDKYISIRNNWEFLLENVVHEISNPDQFFRHFIMSRKTPGVKSNVSSRTLYDKFKSLIYEELPASGTTVSEYVEEMVDISSTYIGLVESSVDYSSGRQRDRINRRLRNLNDIKASHSRTLILRSIEEFDDSSDLLEVLRLLEVFMTRWRISDLTTGASLDRIFSGLCSNAFEKSDPVDIIRTKLREKAPSNDEFRANFANSNFQRNSMTTYILDTMERMHFSGTGKQIDRTKVDIEHIAPQASFSSDKYAPWKNVLDVTEAEFNNQYRNRIGNLTLLEERLNEEASDNPFEQKSDQYKLSEYEMTDEIRKNYTEWTEDTIEERSERLGEIAVDVWSFNPKDKSSDN